MIASRSVCDKLAIVIDVGVDEMGVGTWERVKNKEELVPIGYIV